MPPRSCIHPTRVSAMAKKTRRKPKKALPAQKYANLSEQERREELRKDADFQRRIRLFMRTGEVY
jgi:hypothetical protein